MNDGLALSLWSLALFEAKHFVCDFVLQTAYQYRNKGIYGHPGGLVHAGLHVVGSLPPVLLLVHDIWLIAAILFVEFVIHYHVDWLKEQITSRRSLPAKDALYWIVFGADQLIHQYTYLAILAALASTTQI